MEPVMGTPSVPFNSRLYFLAGGNRAAVHVCSRVSDGFLAIA